MTPDEFLNICNQALGVLFLLFYSYQIIYMIVPFFVKKKQKTNKKLCRYAVMIAARNEEQVIKNLIDSITAQDYPSRLIDVFVVADNCTDGTAETARSAGAEVWERYDDNCIGKGYALSFLLSKIHGKYGKIFDGYFIFDADNLLSPNYITEINKVFSSEYPIVTGCRNSKNYGNTWISAGNALRFLRESEYLNRSRMLLGTDCSVNGTGFVISREVLLRSGGWRFFLTSEDTEFAADCILHGESIGYCHDAVFFDEQPLTFSQSWMQRIRWTRGYMQVFGKYGPQMIKGFFHGNFACYDVGMSNFPAMILSFIGLSIWAVTVFVSQALGLSLIPLAEMTLSSFIGSYVGALIIAGFTTATKWRLIHAPWYKKVLYIFTYPVFMLTYIPISAVAIFGKPEWQQIKHTEAVTLREVVKS
ncbi:MAG: glycosyltransferase family 2 protein [Oscillospiraceae bacterium]